MAFGSFPKGLPTLGTIGDIGGNGGIRKIGKAGKSPKTTKLTPVKISAGMPKRITSVDHLGGMLSGFKRRLSGPNSRLGPPKTPHVRKGKVS